MQERIGDIEIFSISYLDDTRQPHTSSTPSAVVPRTPIQETIAEIWREILGLDTFSIHDNFFQLGGDSLQAGQVLARAREIFRVEPPFQEMFETATVAGMAERIKAALEHSAPPAPPLQPVPRTGPLPLSFSQERMWFIHQLDPQSAAYNVGGAVRFRRAFDPDAFRWSMEQLVARHEVLRTAFPTIDGRPAQVILPAAAWELPIVDLAALPEAERIARVTALAEADVREPFDLNVAPLFKTRVYRLGENDHLLVFNMHHIISDAWSMGVFGREMFLLQQAYADGKNANLPPLPIQYADFAVWQRDWLQDEVLERHLSYWREQLRGATILELPTDRPRPMMQTYHGGTQQFEIDPVLLQSMRDLCRAQGVTLFMFLLAAFKVLLYRYTATDDVAVGVPIANRNFVAIENLIGAFVNTLVVRTDLSGNPTFRELLERVRAVSVEAFAHQDMPFAKLVAELNPERDTSYTPFVQTMFNVINVPMTDFDMPDLPEGVFDLNRAAAQFDLTCTVTDIRDIHRVIFEYNTDLFDDATITRMLTGFQTLLQAIIADPEARINTLPLLTTNETHQILVEWNRTELPYPDGDTIHSLITAQAQRTPDAPALLFGAAQITYRELDERSNQLALYILRLLPAAASDDPSPLGVVVLMDRSPSLVLALLAVMKTGCAYVPLDPKYPTERISFILQDTGAPIILTEQRLLDRLPPHTAQVVQLDTDAARIGLQPKQLIDTSVPPDSPAYIVYTSGSTGVPKGVLGTHRGTTNRIASMQSRFPFDIGEVACFKSPFTFVDSILELFAPLAYGLPVLVLPDATVTDANALVDTLSGYHVTRLVLVPSLLTVLLETQSRLAERLPHLKYWIAGGEAITPGLRDLFYAKLPDAVLINLYGASEASGDSAVHDTRETRHLPFVPIGRSIANTRLYILDDSLQPVPIGVRGELYVGGISLARGYLNQPTLTAEKFIRSPFSGETLYRMGDYVSYLPDGNIRYLGRRDQQYKIRGMRVEGGEIESILRRHPLVTDAVIMLRQDDNLDPRLVGYVLAPNNPPTPSELQAYLRSRLPEHMIPRDIITLDHFPRTSSGKTDRLRFPAPPRPASNLNVEPPETAVQAKLRTIWENLLGTAPIGIDDDFFQLGGHSLLAIRLFAEIEQTFGQKLPVSAIFQTPTIRTLANTIQQQIAPAPWSPLVPIQGDGTRSPFFCVHGLGGGVVGYVPLARHMSEQPFYGLQAYGQDPDQTPDTTIQAMAARYLDAIRTVQPQGPYNIGGYSYGALVAYEMAQQLIRNGDSVALLALFDYAAPGSGYHIARPNRTFFKGFVTNLPAWMQDYAQLDTREQLGRIRRHMYAAPPNTRPQANDPASSVLQQYFDDPSRIPERRRSLIQVHLRAAESYKLKPYPGIVTLLRAKRQPLWCSFDPRLGWGHFAAHVNVHLVSGAHRTILQEPYVRTLARELERALNPTKIT